jgi:tetratricopeptide (TPR) repeat protein
LAKMQRPNQACHALQAAGALAACLLSIPVVWWAWHPAVPVIPPSAEVSASARTPFDTAMEHAWRQWLRDHDGPLGTPGWPGSLRPHDSLRRARADALQALSLAQGPLQECRARFLLAQMEHRAGDHRAELRHTRRLVALQPRNKDAWQALHRAEECNGLKLPARPDSSAPPADRESAWARREAANWYHQAGSKAKLEMEATEAWDPRALEPEGEEAYRRRAVRGTRELRFAVQWAERAVHLAATPADRYAAALLLSRLYCDAGNHRQELIQARALIALAPRRLESLKVLRRAALCNGLKPLAQRADQWIEAQPGGKRGASSDPMRCMARFGPPAP